MSQNASVFCADNKCTEPSIFPPSKSTTLSQRENPRFQTAFVLRICSSAVALLFPYFRLWGDFVMLSCTKLHIFNTKLHNLIIKTAPPPPQPFSSTNTQCANLAQFFGSCVIMIEQEQYVASRRPLTPWLRRSIGTTKVT